MLNEVCKQSETRTRMHHRMRGYVLGALYMKSMALLLTREVARKPGTR